MFLIPNKCYLSNAFCNISIRTQIWIGFGLILAILLVVSLSTLSSFSILNDGISDVTEKAQPVVLAAQNLETELESASNALGFYLLTKEETYKVSYIKHLDMAVNLARQFTDFDLVAEDEAYSAVVKEVQSDLNKLSSYKDRMIELASNDIKNIPAQLIASEKLNPMAQQLQSMISQMIVSDYEEDNADAVRDEFRQAIYDLRYYNVQIASELRTFLAFRSDSNIQNMHAIMEVVESKLKLIQASEELYTFEQSDLMETFINVNSDYYKALNETINVHSTDKYRTDIYLVKTEIGPLVLKTESHLSSLVDQLKELITDTSNELQEQASGASNKIKTGIVIGILLGIIIAFFMARIITFPINAAVDAMDDLAEGEGDLTHRLDEKGKSEIAKMAKSFNRFATKVQALVSQVAGSVENLSTVVGDVSSIVDQTQVGSKQQRQQTEHVASAITEMTTSGTKCRLEC